MDSIGNARRLRREQTDEEKELWRALRAGRFAGFKFRRQHIVGKYFLDFYCPAAKLSVELDGLQHGMSEELRRDEERAQFLSTLGIEELRFWNHQWNKNRDGVLLEIWNSLHRRTGCASIGRKLQNHRFVPPQINSLSPPKRGEGQGEGIIATRLLSPALSSTSWKRGRNNGCSPRTLRHDNLPLEVTEPTTTPNPTTLLPRLVRSGVSVVFLTTAVLFIPAGSLKFWQGWALLASTLVAPVLLVIYFYKRDPQLIERRLLRKETIAEQKLFSKLGAAVFLSAFLLAGMDYRFGWSRTFLEPVPLWLTLLALALILGCELLMF